MKKTSQHLVQIVGLMLVSTLSFLACETSGETPFGKPCETGADCTSNFCVGGEAGTELAPFCSDECAGKKTGEPCGEGQGTCIDDFVSWCWQRCETDAECAAINAERPVCSFTSSNGEQAPFKVCIGKPKS